MHVIETTLAQELALNPAQIRATLALLDEGATVPFIARYRKEATGGIDDQTLRQLEQRLRYLRELMQRKAHIRSAIEALGLLTPALVTNLEQIVSKTELEALYLPFKSKRRTKGQLALEAGLQPLAMQLWQQPTKDLHALAKPYCQENYPTTAAVLEGCQALLAEHFSSDPTVVGALRQALSRGWLCSKVSRGKADEHSKFRDYYQHQERYAKVPSHRALAMLRGRNSGELSLSVRIEETPIARGQLSEAERLLARTLAIPEHGHVGHQWLLQTVQQCWKTKLGPSLDNSLLSALQTQAEQAAIEVFAANMHDLLMAAPAGAKITLALDPGLRTGCKVAVIDATGKVLSTTTIYPHVPQQQWDAAKHVLVQLVQQHQVQLIAIGNGTASRETDRLATELIAHCRAAGQALTKVLVSEAGASVYSASELAASELPQLDVSLRGAVSIGRRLQDPLAELVKIDPKAIGVGQYQHDVNQTQLAHSLDAVVEDCVNRVGVDLNRASPALLARVAGLTPTLANHIVDYRNANGRFHSRAELKKVYRLGPKAFEQCAGFLRINDGTNPLDGSGVHPEAYAVVQAICQQTGLTAAALIGNSGVLNQLDPNQFITAQFGFPTIQDIISELDKPGRDPRGQFISVQFADGVTTLNDLQLGMVLEGVISNVTHFGAFVDIGVKQDGLVHISALADRFVADPRTVVKTGDVVKVKIVTLDIARKRIGLSMRLQDAVSTEQPQSHTAAPRSSHPHSAEAPVANSFAAAFAQAKPRR
ncbi:MAG: Tex family protein [Ferrimonas sp.]